jgi:hypothetical protein
MPRRGWIGIGCCVTLDVRPKGSERMSDILTPLILDFLAWLEATPRPYTEVMDVWRTACPRLTIWEDAVMPVS